MNNSFRFWELTSIQVASIGIPGLILGWQTANQYGVGNAIGAIVIGNLILWLLGLVIVVISAPERINSIANVRVLLGPGAILAAITLIVAFLFWMIFQMKFSINTLGAVFDIKSSNFATGLGAALGVGVSILAIGGLRFIKNLTVICLPILVIGQLVLLGIGSRNDVTGPYWGVSLAAIISIVLYSLAVTIALPNIFRHSQSLPNSVFSLSLMAIFNSFFQISGIWIDYTKLLIIFQKHSFVPFALCFIILITICNMLMNIYYASASWETILPPIKGSNEYALIGLAGTILYLFIPPITFINLICDFIACLALVLLLTSLVQIVIQHRPKTFGKWIGNSSWLVGSIFAIIFNIRQPDETVENLLISLGTCVIFYLIVILIEETAWSVKTILNRE